MATKKAPDLDDTIIAAGDNELDQAIDDLRGVLKSDQDGILPDAGFGGNFGSDFGALADDGDNPFMGSFADPAPAAADSFGASSFASPSFSSSSTAFGNTAFDAPPATAGAALHTNLDLIMDIPIDVQIVLGSSRMQVSGLMNLTEGATIALDRRIGEAVEIMVNGRVIGRGEITVLEDDDTRFGVKLIEINSGKKA